MAAFDMALGINLQDTLNKTISAVYSSNHKEYFMGSYSIEMVGKKAEIKWDISKPPSLELEPVRELKPSEMAESVIPEILKKLPIFKDIRNNISKQVTDSIKSATFRMFLPELTITASLPIGQRSATFSSNVICTVPVNPNGQIGLAAIRLDLDPSVRKLDLLSPIVNSLSGSILQAVNNVLKGIRIPSTSVKGITLGLPTPVISGGRLILLFNLASKASPAPILGPYPWPNEAIFSLSSEELINKAIEYCYDTLKIPHEVSSIGSQETFITTFYYGAILRVGRPGFRAKGENLAVSIQPSGNLYAGFTTIFGNVGFNYNIVIQPTPLECMGRLSLNSSQQLELYIPNVPVAIVLFQPQGNFAETIISTLASIGINIASLILANFLPQIIGSIRIPIANIPSISVDFGDVHLKIQAKDLKVGGFNGMAMIAGSLIVAPNR
jgi:hypothetical protein